LLEGIQPSQAELKFDYQGKSTELEWLDPGIPFPTRESLSLRMKENFCRA
jgi:hypothetical protein